MHVCGIEGCGKKFERGGRASPEAPKLARCPMHYHRERRASPLADFPGVRAAGVRREVYLQPDVDRFFRALAKRDKCSVADVLRVAALDFLSGPEAGFVADVRSMDARRKGKR